MKNNNNTIFQSSEFTLRHYQQSDEKSLHKNINDKEIFRFTTRIPYPYMLEDAKDWIQNCQKMYRAKKKTEYVLVIDIDDEVAGSVSFHNIAENKAEIGYWLGKKFRGKGIMAKAVKVMTEIGFEKFGLEKIYANVFVDNIPSQNVLKKNKYKKEGIIKNYHIKDGKVKDAVLYAKVKMI